jgi:hypothetical protein
MTHTDLIRALTEAVKSTQNGPAELTFNSSERIDAAHRYSVLHVHFPSDGSSINLMRFLDSLQREAVVNVVNLHAHPHYFLEIDGKMNDIPFTLALKLGPQGTN